MSTRKPAPAKSAALAATPAATKAGAPTRHKAVAKPALASKPALAVPVAAPGKAGKAPKLRQKPVRDSFTMPEADFVLIATLKARAMAAQRETKKSELLRAGLHALFALDTPALVAALGQLDPVKIGRPKKGH
jgi:hypothetical protein